MLKSSAGFVLGSSKSSTYRLRCSEVGHTGGVFPFAKIQLYERTAPRSAGGTSSGFNSPAALLVRRRVLAHQSWSGEMSGLFEQS